jgi:DNA-binding response OmpR family regulator
VIAIVSSAHRERSAFAALSDHQGWNAVECDSVQAAKRLFVRVAPMVVLVRFQLDDGYSDDVIAAVRGSQPVVSTRIIVLLNADAPSAIEARQLEIGADCVQRDPVRTDVLLAYVAKFLRRNTVRAPRTPSTTHIEFAEASLNALERTLDLRGVRVTLTPREVRLAEMLAGAAGEIVTYESLYSELLGRRLRGDTSNMRVLLGILCASVKPLGIILRDHISVIPKSGYRYGGITSGSSKRFRRTDDRS